MKYGEITLHYRLELKNGLEYVLPSQRMWELLRHRPTVAYAIIETRHHGRVVAVERYANTGRTMRTE